MENGATIDDYVVGGSAGASDIADAAFHADGVVARIDRTACEQCMMAGAEIYAVTVLRIPGTTHHYTIEDEMVAKYHIDMKTRRVLHHDTLYHKVGTTYEAEQSRTLGVEVAVRVAHRGIVDLTAFLSHFPQTESFHFGPLGIAHLKALDRSPCLTVAVDDTLAGD